MQDDAAHRDDDMDAQFEQSFAQPRHLRAGTRGARGPQPEFLHEDVRGGRQEYAELIGQKRVQLVRPIWSPSCSSLIRFSM